MTLLRAIKDTKNAFGETEDDEEKSVYQRVIDDLIENLKQQQK